MTTINIRVATSNDLNVLYDLYLIVAGEGGGLARTETEVSLDYVEGFLSESLTQGLILIAEDKEGTIGSMHAYAPGPAQFRHVLSNLTIAIHPRAQGQGLGRRLFEVFLTRLHETMPHIRRVELMCRESNQRGIALYQRLGFILEGRLKDRVWDAAGTFEDDLMWGLDLKRLKLS